MCEVEKQKQSKAFAGISIDSQDQNMDFLNIYVSKLSVHESHHSSPREKITFGGNSSHRPPRYAGRGRCF